MGSLAALLFYTLPLTAWLSQTAYIDLFATLFVLATALVLVRAGAPKTWRSIGLVATFVLLGFGVKASFGSMGIGLVLGTMLLLAWRFWRRPWAVLAAILTLIIGAAAGLLLATSTLNAFPGYAAGLRILGRVWGASADTFSTFATYGKGHSLGALLRAPVNVTYCTCSFGEYQRGFTGYYLLAFLPPVVFARPNRRVVLVSVVGLAVVVVWFLLAQYLRYAMPFFAVLTPVAAYSFVAASGGFRSRRTGAALQAVLALVTSFGMIAYLHTILIYPGVLPFRVALGLQSKTAYLRDHVTAFTAMQLLNADAGAVRAFAPYEYPRLYSQVRISSPLSTGTAVTWSNTEETALKNLDAGGYTHIIVDRGLMMPYWDEMTAINETFLRRNAVLVGGDHNRYLYRLVPPAERGRDQNWAEGPELLSNPGFEEARNGAPLGWTATGSPIYDASVKQSHTGSSAVRSTMSNTLSTTIQVEPNVQYLLSHTSKSADGAYDLARLQINWLDASGAFISAAVDVVPTSPTGYNLFSMPATAPGTARSAIVYVQAQQGTVWFDDFSLKAVQPDRRAVDDKNLLADPNFAGLAAGTSTAWQPYGKQGRDGAGVETNPDGSSRVYARLDSGFMQLAPVTPRQSYRLAYNAWSVSAAQARLQINWIDASKQFITAATQVKAVGAYPAQYTAWMTAPPSAAYAVVYVSVQSGGPVWFSDYALNAEKSAAPPHNARSLGVSRAGDGAEGDRVAFRCRSPGYSSDARIVSFGDGGAPALLRRQLEHTAVAEPSG